MITLKAGPAVILIYNLDINYYIVYNKIVLLLKYYWGHINEKNSCNNFYNFNDNYEHFL